MEALLETIPDNLNLRVFMCAAFVHEHKEAPRHEFEGRSERRIYLGSDQRLHMICLIKSKRAMTRKDVFFDEKEFLFSRKQKEEPTNKLQQKSTIEETIPSE